MKRAKRMYRRRKVYLQGLAQLVEWMKARRKHREIAITRARQRAQAPDMIGTREPYQWEARLIRGN